MAVGLIGMLDLSIVTDQLVAVVTQAFEDSPLWSGNPPLLPTGSAPHTISGDGESRVSVYLFHVAQDPHQLNVPLIAQYQLNGVFPPPAGKAVPQVPPRAYEIPFLPLALDLYYLLTAYAGDDYRLEQKAMSVAMTCLHENPIVRTTVVLDGQSVNEEFSVTMAVESADELSRLWQATTAPLRLSAVYKVGVVFLAPKALGDVEAPPVESVVAVADAVDLPLDTLGDVSGTSFATSYALPDGTLRNYDPAPAVAAPGDTFALHGAGLDQATAARVYIVPPPPGSSRIEVTAWRADSPPSSTNARIELPPSTGPAPGGTPEAGVYQIGVGDQATHDSRLTPFSIAPRVDPGVGTALLVPTGGVYHITGAGFVSGQTELMLGTTRLTEAGGPPAAGTFVIGAGGTSVDFAPPPSLPAGRYAVRVRVNDVESKPAWWVQL
jgi:Pvc16 N-terminal domain